MDGQRPLFVSGLSARMDEDEMVAKVGPNCETHSAALSLSDGHADCRASSHGFAGPHRIAVEAGKCNGHASCVAKEVLTGKCGGTILFISSSSSRDILAKTQVSLVKT